MRILFVASIHHPEALRAAVEQAAREGKPAPLFPPSMSQHFWEKALIKRGHTLDAFYRNQPALRLLPAAKTTEQHSERITPRKLAQAALNRIPPSANPDVRLRNQRLIERAREFKPDVLWMVGDNTVIYPETVAAIKHLTRCTVVYATGTSPIVFSHAIDRRAAALYDLVLVNDYYHGIQWLELGAHKMVALPIAACDPDFHRPYELTDEERAQYGCDVAFVGTLVPDHLYSQRVKALEALRDFNLGIWSVHEVPPSLKPFYRGAALGEDMERILSAAKICFNTHGNFMRYGGNLRLFEVAGAGVFQVTDDLPGVRVWFPDVNGTPTILSYSDLDDLRAKVTHYLAHEDERQAIAANGRAHVYTAHTYDDRAAEFERLIATITP